MKRAVKLLVLLFLSFGVATTSAEADSEIENDLMQMAQSPSDNPSHLAKNDLIGENSSHFWPEIPFLERFMSYLFPLHKQSRQTTTTHGPSIMWSFRIVLLGNNSDELLAAATEGAADNGDQHLVQKMGLKSSSPVPTKNSSKSSRRKRNKEHEVGQLAKRLSLYSYSNVDGLENNNTEGKNRHKKPKNDKKLISIHDMSHHFNKSSSSTPKTCYRRFYTYVWSVDWTSLFIHVFVVLVFVLVLTVALVTCHALTNGPTGFSQRVKITPAKPGAFQVYSV